MKFDLERAFSAVLWAIVSAAVLVLGVLWVALIARVPALGLVLAGLALAFVIGGFWPRRR